MYLIKPLPNQVSTNHLPFITFAALPGYYFDPETNRYYKIDKSHKPPQAPTPPPSKLTREEVSLLRKQAPPTSSHIEKKKIIINFKHKQSPVTNKQAAFSAPSTSTNFSSTIETVPCFINRREIGFGMPHQFER